MFQYGRLWFTAILCSFGGAFQFGYLISVLNEPTAVIRDFVNESHDKQYNSFMSQSSFDVFWSATAATLNAGMVLAGIILIRPSLTYLGRKKSLYVMSMLVIIGNFLSYLSYPSETYQMLVVGRFVSALGACYAVTVSIVFLTEISPKKNRGAVACINAVCMEFGTLLGNVFGYPSVLGSDTSWPYLLLLPLVFPVLLLLIVPCYCPESPKYLLTKSFCTTEAMDSISFYHGTEADLSQVMRTIQRENNVGKTPLMELLKQEWSRKMMYLITTLAVGEGLTAKFVFLSLLTDLLIKMGYSATVAANMSIIIPAVELTFGLSSFWTVDHWGRRPVLLLGFFGAGSSMLVIFLCQALQSGADSDFFNTLTLMALVANSLTRCCGYNKVVFMIETEIFPTQARPTVTTYRSVLLDIFNAIVTFTFIPIMSEIGSVVFLFLAIAQFVSGFIVKSLCPETKCEAVADILDHLREVDVNEEEPNKPAEYQTFV